MKLRSIIIGLLATMCMIGCCACPSGGDFDVGGGEPVLFGIRIKVDSSVDLKSLQVYADKHGETNFLNKDGTSKNWIGHQTPNDSGIVYTMVFTDSYGECDDVPPLYSIAPIKIMVARNYEVDTILTFDRSMVQSAVKDSIGYYLGEVSLFLKSIK